MDRPVLRETSNNKNTKRREKSKFYLLTGLEGFESKIK